MSNTENRRSLIADLLDILLRAMYIGANRYAQKCYSDALELYNRGDLHNAAERAYAGICHRFGLGSKEWLYARDLIVRAGFHVPYRRNEQEGAR